MIITIIDTETTSLKASDGHVIEIAGLNFETSNGGHILDSFSVLIRAPKDDVAKTFKIHGIRPEVVSEWGVDKSTAMKVLASFSKGATAFVAHNAEFDSQWIDWDIVPRLPFVCSMDDIQWPRESQAKNLAAVALAHGVGVVSAHRAMDDVMTLARVFLRAGEILGSLDELMAKALRPRAMFKAVVSYDQREIAKAAGFRWEPETKSWLKRLAIEDAATIGFRVDRV